MMCGCELFNKNLQNMDLSNVKEARSMFSRCYSLESHMCTLKINNAANKENMFFNCRNMKNQREIAI